MDEGDWGVLVAGLTGITVVTVTRRRAEMLRRAMASVDRQDYSGVIEHLIVVDDDRQTINSLAGWESRMQRPVTIEAQGPVASRQEGSRAFVYPHLARLLNVGISLARFPWIAFLDDDNEFEADHVSSLVALAQETGARAVHSGRAFVWPDGTPYLERHLPSAATLEEGQRLYELLCRRGVWVRDTNIVLDRVDSGVGSDALNSTVMDDGDPVFLVDQNLWLVQRDLLLDVPVPDDFTSAEIDQNTCPDDKMLAALIAAGVEIYSTGRPTVRYTVGGNGISNGGHVQRTGSASLDC